MCHFFIKSMERRKYFCYFFIFLSLSFSSTKSTSGQDCRRNCTLDPNPKTCTFEFLIEEYLTLNKACLLCPLNITDCLRPQCIAANGIQRMVTVVNRELPGPSINVCQGDSLEFVIINAMTSQSTSIHWHGIKLNGFQYMDGVPMVTQCPILPLTSFRYSFPVPQAGTYFWHGHSGLQRSDGLFGALIVRSSYDEMAQYYDVDDYDHVITINDWMSMSSEDAFEFHVQSNGSNHPESLLVNGQGRFKKFYSKDGEESDETLHTTPLKVFYVNQGMKYRFRVIYSGVFNCPVQLSVDGHQLLVIASDGSNLEPQTADSIIINSGERYDFVLHANQVVSNYWIKFRGLFDCDYHFTSSFQMAVLNYKGADLEEPTENEFTYKNCYRPGKIFNPVDMDDANSVNSLSPINANISRSPDVQIYMAFDFEYINNPLFNDPIASPMNKVPIAMRRPLPLINNIYLQMPSSPLLSQFNDVPKETICEPSTVKNCSLDFCRCLYMYSIPLNSLVEIVLVDEGYAYNTTHPIHLHGYSFNVVAMKKVGYSVKAETIKAMDREGKIRRKFHRPVEKDTVAVPSGGYVIIRFYADNPGFWFLHCHLEFHLEMGMGVIFQVGKQNDYNPPPFNFPKCGNYNNSS